MYGTRYMHVGLNDNLQKSTSLGGLAGADDEVHIVRLDGAEVFRAKRTVFRPLVWGLRLCLLLCLPLLGIGARHVGALGRSAGGVRRGANLGTGRREVAGARVSW